MKLNIKEIKYIRQSLEHRSIYYETKPQYKQFYNELKPIIKKFKKIEGLKGLSFTEINHKQIKQQETMKIITQAKAIEIITIHGNLNEFYYFIKELGNKKEYKLKDVKNWLGY